VVVACDRQFEGREGRSASIARSVLKCHGQIRRRALRRMLSDRAGPQAEHPRERHTRVSIARCQRRAARWTDLLIGHVLVEHDVAQFAFDPRRARQFARDIGRLERRGHGPIAERLTLSGLEAAFREGRCWPSPNADLGVQIAASMLSCFELPLDRPLATVHSLWITQLLGTASRATEMVDSLLAPDRRAAATRRSPGGGPPAPLSPPTRTDR
jgi:hypothetical protein